MLSLFLFVSVLHRRINGKLRLSINKQIIQDGTNLLQLLIINKFYTNIRVYTNVKCFFGSSRLEQKTIPNVSLKMKELFVK